MHGIAAAIILLIAFNLDGKSQDNLSFQLITPPGNELRIDESLQAIIMNSSGREFEVYLKGNVVEAQEGIIFEGSSGIITLPEGTTNLNKRNIRRLEPFETNFMSNEYERYVTRTSAFPPGQYEVCVQVILAAEEQIIAESCYQKTIQDFLPPSLISPENTSAVIKTHPFFSWSPVPGSTGDSGYVLVFREV